MKIDQTMNHAVRWSRRELIARGALGATALAFGGEALAQGVPIKRRGVYGPFHLGIQSYSLRGYKFEEALDRSHGFGLQYWEAFQAHVPLTDSPARIAGYLDKFKANNIKLLAWGVQGFDANEANARKVFEFARAMGIKVITADPSPEALPVLDKLLGEYTKADIRVAIHNHGPGSRYDKISSVANALKGRHVRLGACIDTGHYLRSGEDPVEAVRVFGKRTYGAHLKDVKNQTEFTILGMGDLRLVDFLVALRKTGFEHMVALEYEEKPENPIIDIDLCLAAARDAAEKQRFRK